MGYNYIFNDLVATLYVFTGQLWFLSSDSIYRKP